MLWLLLIDLFRKLNFSSCIFAFFSLHIFRFSIHVFLFFILLLLYFTSSSFHLFSMFNFSYGGLFVMSAFFFLFRHICFHITWNLHLHLCTIQHMNIYKHIPIMHFLFLFNGWEYTLYECVVCDISVIHQHSYMHLKLQIFFIRVKAKSDGMLTFWPLKRSQVSSFQLFDFHVRNTEVKKVQKSQLICCFVCANAQ